VKDLAAKRKRAIFLGEHHDSGPDHLLQAGVIRQAHALRGHEPMAVGLEAVQQRFQPALDAYVAGRITEAELEEAVEWKKRWFWPFDRYLPVFQACRELGIPLLALNVDSEDLSKVEIRGFPALPKETLRGYVPDANGFGAFASTTAFKEYVAFVIKPSYAIHQRMGVLRNTITGQKLKEDISFRNFYSCRILWDEAMASASVEWCRANPEGLLIGLVGSDHVKFSCGVPARCARQLPGGLASVATVMLNPNPSDIVSDPSNCHLSDSTHVLAKDPPNFGRGRGGFVNFDPYVLQLLFAPATDGNGPPLIGAAPEDREKAAAMSQASAGSSVLKLSEYLIFSKEPINRV